MHADFTLYKVRLPSNKENQFEEENMVEIIRFPALLDYS
jgi:hypothetical protein